MRIHITNPATTRGREQRQPYSHSFHWQAPEQKPVDRNNIYHDLWREVHMKQDANAEWYAGWLNRIPCSVCKTSLKAILEQLGPPDYTDWFDYSVRLHNAVNRKLGKHELTHDEAKAIWQ
jgi:hypothetical protein